MKLFSIVSPTASPRLEKVIGELYPKDHLRLSFNAWMVAADTTAEALSKELGIFDGTNGSGLVFGVTSYFGRAPKRTRDWITKRFAPPEPSGG